MIGGKVWLTFDSRNNYRITFTLAAKTFDTIVKYAVEQAIE